MPDRALGYCKLCELGDFSDPDLRALMREIYGRDGEYPDGSEHRKSWEVAMTARALRDFGALREDAEVLGVGAGREATIFWLTRHVKRVFATDLYLYEDSWSANDSSAKMLAEPSGEPGVGWNARRLVVQHMDGKDLHYEDGSFDGIFSSGSIEHFGSYEDIRRSVEEMYRVLKPGGITALATEFRLEGEPPGLPGTVIFNEQELKRVVLDGVGWELASPLDLSLSEETLGTELDWWSLFVGGRPEPIPHPTLRQRIRTALTPRSGRKPEESQQLVPLPTVHPHVVLRQDSYLWTSVHLALIKPRDA